jgi:hypothetical protein
MKLRHYKRLMPRRAPSPSPFRQQQKAPAPQLIRKVGAPDLLSFDPALADITFEPPRADIRLRPADFS